MRSALGAALRIASAAAIVLGQAALHAQAAAPKLAVVIVVDQLRADYLLTFREHFGADGFERFLSRGAWLTQARYEHAATVTCAGHATVLTGSSPAVTGIIGNDWWNREAGREEYCSQDDGAALVGANGEGRSPRNLFGATVGDMLRIATNGAGRVVSIAGKDRSAIMLGGHLTDSAYWLEGLRVATSKYYRPDLPEWAAEYNAARFAASAFGKTWGYALPAAAYAALGADDAPGERDKPGLGTTFPHVIGAGLAGVEDKHFVEAFEHSPFADEAVADLAMRAVIAERLGRGPATDLLAIGFSAPDRIGHAFGPNSHEVLDITVRTDRLLAGLFAFLDQEVGRDRYVAVLTADHGVAPLPETVSRLNPNAGALRHSATRVSPAIEAALVARFGPRADRRPWLAYHDAPYIYLDERALTAAGIGVEHAEQTVRAALLADRGVASAYTRTELMGLQTAGVENAVTLGFHPARGGNVYYSRAPFVLEDDEGDGTTHGSPWSYDRQVPLLWYGAGIAPGIHHGEAHVRDIAPTLSWLLGVLPPPTASGRVLAEVLR